uniref:glutaminase n=1 Tax=Acrobeloides nanus TaxID=290746 RepID=A0A914DM48_9BILA
MSLMKWLNRRLCFLKIFTKRSLHAKESKNNEAGKFKASIQKLPRNFQEVLERYRNPETGQIAVTPIVNALRENGLFSLDDPRLRPFFKKLSLDEMELSNDDYAAKEQFSKSRFMEVDTFIQSIERGYGLVTRALRGELTIPNWQKFTEAIGRIFTYGKKFDQGQVATYIPQLARIDPKKWAVSICTIDGQTESWGDFRDPFCMQSVSKPFTYAIAIEQLGADYVHSFVGQEPSGRLFNEICLNNVFKPHNPMINAGAIVVASLLYQKEVLSTRFEYSLREFDRFAGGGRISFNNAVFLSERETADRNYALAYYMREHKCYPEKTNIREALDLYFQLCSVSTTTNSLAVMAATLANGGICPLTKDRVVCTIAVRDTLSLMLSCGMYDYSGQHAFKVGLPAKSGVSGAMIIVIPNLMGIALYSPPLDMLGNPVRGVKFAEKLVEEFKFHQYDSLVSSDCEKIDPRI